MTGPRWFMPGPLGITYGVALYAGCQDCDTPAAVILFRIPDAEMPHFQWGDTADAPGVPWVKCHGWEERWVTVADGDALQAALRRIDEEEMDEDCGPDDLIGAARHAYIEVARANFTRIPDPAA